MRWVDGRVLVVGALLSGCTLEREVPAELVRSVGLTALGLWALGSLVAAVFQRRERSESEGSGGLVALAGAALTGLVAFGVRFALAAPTPIHDDGLRDLGSGMTCGLEGCRWTATASVGDFEHGTSLTRLLGVAHHLGVGVDGMQLGFMVLSALAVAVVYLAGRRMARPGLETQVGVLAAAGYFALLLSELIEVGEIVWNPSLVALPVALTQAALVRGAVTGRAVPLIVAGAFAGFAFDAHLAGLILWPALVLVSVAVVDRGAAKPAWVWAASLAGALSVPMLVSPRSAGIAGTSLLNHLGWGGGIAVGLAGSVAAAGLRAFVRRAEGDERTRQRLVAVCVPIGTLACALVAVSDVVDDPPARYTAPVYPALALVGAALAGVLLDRLAKPRRRVRFVALAVLATLALSVPAYAWRMSVDRSRWNYRDVDTLATWLRERGVGRDRVHLALRGGTCGGELYSDRGQRLDELLVAGLRALGRLEPGSGSERVWLVTKVASAELAELPDGAITLSADSSHTIVLVPDEPLIGLANVRGCARLDDGSTSCVAATPLPTRLERRQVLPRHEWVPIPEGRHATQAYYELTLRGPTEGRRTSRVQVVGNDGWNYWRFTEVEGDVEVDASTRSEHTIDLRMDAGAEGLLRVETEEVDEALGHMWSPPILERPADSRTRELFELEPDD
ncbi:MAG: hypothetical protein JJ863_26620 [Deltaproteobacteria bacterium]|nr:hypothetical protein [Deltaproteobacteria bacterium]